ncbi:MAG: bifunctional hydroxymethylpyrimidine kinase/phosphomethylpyrimidine kinase, partial [Pseudomonadota bacterium]
MSAVTAITAQNTLGVHAVHAIPSDIVSRQIDVVLDDLGADAIKIGMLKSSDIIEAVAASLGRHS